jgi:hypothetical protein
MDIVLRMRQGRHTYMKTPNRCQRAHLSSDKTAVDRDRFMHYCLYGLLATPGRHKERKRRQNCITQITYIYSTSRTLNKWTPTVYIRSGDRIPVEARFSAHVQSGPEAHPASCTVGTGSFPGVKRPGRGVDHPPSSTATVKERV